MNAVRRSRLVTIVAWLLMLGSALLLPISFISALMFLVGSDGTANASLGGAALIVLGPPACLAAGFGLWRRWRWAWAGVVLLLVGVLLTQVAGWWQGPTPEHSFVSASGVRTTISASDAPFSMPLILICIAVLGLLLLRSVRAEFFVIRSVPSGTASVSAHATPAALDDAAAAKRGWRVGHQGRDRLYYEEWHDGRWRRLDIEGEMLTGEAHHAVHLATPARWLTFPDWARDRREEIVARIRSELCAPDYVYGDERHAAPPLSRTPLSVAPVDSSSRPATWGVALALLLCSALMAWLVWHGLATGETWWPAKSAGARRIVTRAADAPMYWTALVLFASIGLGTMGLLGWGWRTSRSSPTRR